MVLDNIPAPPQAEPDDDALISKIMELPGKYREVILLYYYQQLTVPEIADMLRLSPDTVYSRLRRAREKLKPKLEACK